MAPADLRYYVDEQGYLMQAVKPGPHSPRSGWRNMGRVGAITRLDGPGVHLEVELTFGLAGDRRRTVYVNGATFEDRRTVRRPDRG